MTNELNEPEFYARREVQARAMADQADDMSIAAIHRQMADRYATLARTAGWQVRRSA